MGTAGNAPIPPAACFSSERDILLFDECGGSWDMGPAGGNGGF